MVWSTLATVNVIPGEFGRATASGPWVAWPTALSAPTGYLPDGDLLVQSGLVFDVVTATGDVLRPAPPTHEDVSDARDSGGGDL